MRTIRYFEFETDARRALTTDECFLAETVGKNVNDANAANVRG